MIGAFRHRITFQKRAAANDGYGNVIGPFEDQFTERAKVTWLKGREDVQAARLQGVQPAVIRVHANSSTRQISAAWRCKDANTEEIFEIKSVRIDGDDERFIDLLCERGAPG